MRVIQMGVGGFGEVWSAVLSKADGIELVAMVDTSSDQLEAACERHDYPATICYPSLGAALEQVSADMVVCVTPPAFHLEQVTEALRAGMHVLVEKPFATTFADAQTMTAVAAETGRCLAVSQNYRYHPPMQALARLVREGAVGAIGQIRLDFYKGWYFDETNFRRTMPHPLLLDMAIHHFDLVRYVTGLEATTVSAESWNPPWSENSGDTSAAARFVMHNEARFVYSASWCAQGDFCDWNGNWHIDGDKGSLAYDHGTVTLNHAAGRYTVEISEEILVDTTVLSSQKALLEGFVEAIESGAEPMTSAADNLRSMAMVFSAVESADTHQSVQVYDA